MMLKIAIDPVALPTEEELELAETTFDRETIPDVNWARIRKMADDVTNALGFPTTDIHERLLDGDKWYPYVLASVGGEPVVRVCGWNEMVETYEAGTWVMLTPPTHEGCHVNGGGSHLYYPDGTFKFQTHGAKERKGSTDYPVIEDLAGDHARQMFPDRYIRLPDGREGIRTDGLSQGDLKSIMRETGHRVADRGEPTDQQTNLKAWKADIRRRLVDQGCNPDLGWVKLEQ